MNRLLLLVLASLLVGPFACRTAAPPSVEQEWAAAVEQALTVDLWEQWFPLCVDTEYGGYLSDFEYDWQVSESPQNKMIVTQARHLWSASKAATRYPDDPRYRAAADHGFRFLQEKMWDAEYGGFFNLVSRDGTPLGEPEPGAKQAYGISFAIYGLAAYHRMSGNPEALILAQAAFYWLEEHAHDAENGGYFPFLTRSGEVISRGENPHFPYKDQNPTIHLLEAFTELYPHWQDSLLATRLEEQLKLVRDVITQPEGYMGLYFYPDWRRLSYRDSSVEAREAHYSMDHVSFGHDVETAYLMLEACEVLDRQNCEPTLMVGKKMLDHSLFEGGFDWEKGGFYEQGYYFAGEDTLQIIDRRKNWWAQAEGLHTLLLFSQHFPEESRYREAADLEWSYIQTYLMDADHGGWYSYGLDESPEYRTNKKGHIWKGSYHNGRALMRCIDLLRPTK